MKKKNFKLKTFTKRIPLNNCNTEVITLSMAVFPEKTDRILLTEDFECTRIIGKNSSLHPDINKTYAIYGVHKARNEYILHIKNNSHINDRELDIIDQIANNRSFWSQEPLEFSRNYTKIKNELRCAFHELYLKVKKYLEKEQSKE